MNMKKKSFWRQGILALCLACMCFACGGGEKKAPLGASKGLPGELLLIVDASLWKTSARDSLEDVLKGSRWEERRVGKECSSRWSPYD